MLDTTRIHVTDHALENYNKRIGKATKYQIEKIIRGAKLATKNQRKIAWIAAHWDRYICMKGKVEYRWRTGGTNENHMIVVLKDELTQTLFVLRAMDLARFIVVTVYHQTTIKREITEEQKKWVEPKGTVTV